MGSPPASTPDRRVSIANRRTGKPMTYTHGHHESVLRSHKWRTVDNSAAYLAPYLTTGTSVLDLGCGPRKLLADARGADTGALGFLGSGKAWPPAHCGKGLGGQIRDAAIECAICAASIRPAERIGRVARDPCQL